MWAISPHVQQCSANIFGVDRRWSFHSIRRTACLFNLSYKNRYLLELYLQLLEFFGAGTAAVITPINRIGYLDHNIDIPTTAQAQPVYQRLKDTLLAIQYGHIAEHPYVKIISQQLILLATVLKYPNKLPKQWKLLIWC